MKKLYVLITIIACFALSCSTKSGKPSASLEEIQSLYKSGKYNQIKSCYTSGTLKVMDQLNKLTPSSKSQYGLDRLFGDGVKWDIAEEKIEGNSAIIKIIYTAHPVENMKGYEMTFKMKNENGVWKWDMESELKESFDLIKKMKKIR